MNWYISVLKKYAVFSGRARRQEYWSFMIINFLISVGIIFLSSISSAEIIISSAEIIIYLLYSLLVLIPSLAVTVRRFHDIGRSGWWLFFPILVVVVFLIVAGLAIIVGLAGGAAGLYWETILGFLLLSAVSGFFMFLLLLQNSQPGENHYGPNPKEEAAQESSPDNDG